MNSQMVTVPEAANRVGVHVETVRRWIRERRIAATRVKAGRPGYRIHTSEVERMAREMEPSEAGRLLPEGATT